MCTFIFRYTVTFQILRKKFFYIAGSPPLFKKWGTLSAPREDNILSAIDAYLFFIINRDTQNILFDVLMPLISDQKFWYPFILAGFIYIFYRDRKKASAVFLMALLALGISEYLTSYFFKPFFGRLRPCNALEGVHLLVGCSDSFSLPSAHASNVAATCAVVSYEYRKLIIYMAVVVLLVCYSRVYLGVHYPLDVLMGMLSGAAYGLTVVGIKKGLLKWNADNAD